MNDIDTMHIKCNWRVCYNLFTGWNITCTPMVGLVCLVHPLSWMTRHVLSTL